MQDVFGRALYDWHSGIRVEKLWINNKYGAPEEMPIGYYFRSAEALPQLEKYALSLCKGHILDVGAGAGAHALTLQKLNKKVTALEISPLAAKVLSARGVNQILEGDIFTLKPNRKYNTILLLMNGLGVAQNLDGLNVLFETLKGWLAPGGKILFDSSDVYYLYNNALQPSPLPTDRYYGEIEYQYEYGGLKTEWFTWLYVDYATFAEYAQKAGYRIKMLAQDDEGHYLGELKI